MKQVVIVLSSLLIFVSCYNEKGLVVSEFRESIPLKGEPLVKVNPYFTYKLIVSDTLLIVQNQKGPFVFEVYNTTTFEKIAEVGTFGRGPNEFISPEFTGQVSEFNNKTYHHFFDFVSGIYSKINFQESIVSKVLKADSETINKDFTGINKIIHNSDEFMYVIPDNEEEKGRLKIYNHFGEKDKVVSYEPEASFNILEENKEKIYTISGFCVNDLEKKIILSPSFLGQFDFFNFSGDYLYSTFVDTPGAIKNAASKRNLFENNLMLYHTEIQKKDSLIYSLYLPATMDEMKSWKPPLNKTKILVLDWDGNPIREYLLDRQISAFVIDEKNNCFYGHCFFEKTTPIIRYRLN